MIKEKNYYSTAAWMVTELGLKGSRLSIYSILYGFSIGENDGFSGSINYLCEFTGQSRNTVIRSLLELVKLGLITKESEEINRNIHNTYRTVRTEKKELKKAPEGASSKSGMGQLQKGEGASSKMGCYNIEDNIVNSSKEQTTKENKSLTVLDFINQIIIPELLEQLNHFEELQLDYVFSKFLKYNRNNLFDLMTWYSNLYKFFEKENVETPEEYDTYLIKTNNQNKIDHQALLMSTLRDRNYKIHVRLQKLIRNKKFVKVI